MPTPTPTLQPVHELVAGQARLAAALRRLLQHKRQADERARALEALVAVLQARDPAGHFLAHHVQPVRVPRIGPAPEPLRIEAIWRAYLAWHAAQHPGGSPISKNSLAERMLKDFHFQHTLKRCGSSTCAAYHVRINAGSGGGPTHP